MANHFLQKLYSYKQKSTKSSLIWLLPLAVMALIISPQTRELTVNSLADAFWQVSSYVAFTLTVFYSVSAKLQGDKKFTIWLRENKKLQVFKHRHAKSVRVLHFCHEKQIKTPGFWTSTCQKCVSVALLQWKTNKNYRFLNIDMPKVCDCCTFK